MDRFSYKVGVAYVNECVLRHLKKELAWVIDKWLQNISNKMLLKTVVPLRIYRISRFKFKKYCMHCYVILSNVFLINAYEDVYSLFTAMKAGQL